MSIVLVTGPPRSGTTMLNIMLCSDESRPLLPECSYLTSLVELYARAVLYSDPDRFEAYLGGRSEGRELFKKLLTEFLGHVKRRLLGAEGDLVLKDPELSVLLPFAREVFPDDTKIIVLLRDPRDAIASLKEVRRRQKADWDIRGACASLFRYYHEIYRYFEAGRDVRRDLFVRYEDLVGKKRSATRRVRDFVGFELNDSGRTARRFDGQDPFYSDLYGRPLSAERVGSYKTRLSPDEIALLNAEFAGVLEFWEYAGR